MKFRGFGFSIDAVFAFMLVAAIIAAAFLYFNQSTSYLSSSRPVLQEVSQDGVNLLSRVKIIDIRREPLVVSYFESGYLDSSDLNLSILEVIGAFWASGNYTQATALADAIVPKFVPGNLDWAIEYDGSLVSSSADIPNSYSLSSSKRFVSGLNDSAPSTGCIARSFVERIRGKEEVSTVYFGGFIGQGNYSVAVSDVPVNSNITSFIIQADSGLSFSFYVNGYNCANLTPNLGLINVTTWNITTQACLNQFVPGAANEFAFKYLTYNITDSYFDGGYLQVHYQTDALVYPSATSMIVKLPQIDGLVNYFSSFYVPGIVTNATVYTKFFNNYTTFMNIGNKTLFETNGSDQIQEIYFSNASFATFYPNLNTISSTTVPFRFTAVANATGQTGYADIVLITDLSGSMAWRMDSDSTSGVSVSNCSSAAINYANTSRLSVAKCVDKSFVEAIMQGPGNQIALVSFSSGIVNFTNFTNNSAYLTNTINAYTTTSSTCVACSINKAYDLLSAYSSPSRKKYVIVMTDGVANMRAISFCPNSNPFNEIDAVNNTDAIIAGRGDGTTLHLGDKYFGDVGTDLGSSFDFYAIDYDSATRAFMSGDNGQIWEKNGASWSRTLNAGGGISLYGISVSTALSKGFAVGDSGRIYKWNGATWSLDTDTGSNIFYDVDVYNATFAFAVGENGLIYKWNGATWSSTDLGSQTFYDVKIISPTFAFATGRVSGGGNPGVIYTWNGAAWSLASSTNGKSYYAMDALNASFALVGSSSGSSYLYNGTLNAMSTPSTAQINGITFVNSSYALAATSTGVVWYWTGNLSWQLLPTVFNVYEGNLTNGIDCGDSSNCGSAQTGSTLNANYSACRLYNEISNSTINSVGFGPVSTCSLGRNTLENIAACGNGTYFGSSNASQLADFYRTIALSIVIQKNASQIKNVSGDVNTTLYNDSYIQFTYVPEVVNYNYQQISLPFETDYFSSCTGSVYIPNQTAVDEFIVTSYSADKWTDNVSIQNSANNWRTIYNLSVYNTTYVDMGDAFMVRIPPQYIKSGEWNNISIKTGYGAGNVSSFCSTYNKALYRGRITAAVNYSSIFLHCTSKTVRVYYDLNHDGTSDGYVDVTIGAGLPSGANSTITPSQLNTTYDATDDAFMRLLNVLNSVTTNASGVAGSITNPIDIKLDSQIGTQAVTNKGVPFLWGPVEATLITWPKGANG